MKKRKYPISSILSTSVLMDYLAVIAVDNYFFVIFSSQTGFLAGEGNMDLSGWPFKHKCFIFSLHMLLQYYFGVPIYNYFQYLTRFYSWNRESAPLFMFSLH